MRFDLLTKEYKLKILNDVKNALDYIITCWEVDRIDDNIGGGMCYLIGELTDGSYYDEINIQLDDWFDLQQPNSMEEQYSDYRHMNSPTSAYWFTQDLAGDKERLRYIKVLIKRVENDEI